MSTFHHEEILEIIRDAQESPKKYIRISCLASNKGLYVKETYYPITKALLVYWNGVRAQTITTDSEDSRFILVCHPKRHMAMAVAQNAPTRYFFIDLKRGEDHQISELQNLNMLVCVVETECKETFVLAFMDGLYFLQTFDLDQAATLYRVFQGIIACNNNRKEVELHEQEQDTQADQI